MKNWTVAKRLIVGFGAVTAVTVMLGSFAAVRLAPITTVATGIKNDAVPGVSLFGEIRANALTSEALTLEEIFVTTLQPRGAMA